MKQRSVVVLTISLLLIALCVFVYTRYVVPAMQKAQVAPVATSTPKKVTPKPKAAAPLPAGNTTPSDVHNPTSVEKYVAAHISDFSTVKEQLGGKFQVSQVLAKNGEGVVSYDDGHSAYVADFTYSVDDFGSISIDSFVVRQ